MPLLLLRRKTCGSPHALAELKCTSPQSPRDSSASQKHPRHDPRKATCMIRRGSSRRQRCALVHLPHPHSSVCQSARCQDITGHCQHNVPLCSSLHYTFILNPSLVALTPRPRLVPNTGHPLFRASNTVLATLIHLARIQTSYTAARQPGGEKQRCATYAWILHRVEANFQVSTVHKAAKCECYRV